MKSSVELNHGEWLWVKRRRLGHDQVKMAEDTGISRHQYQAAEASVTGRLHRMLDDHERCALYRRREKITQGAVAKSLGTSRLWVNKMETGLADASKLVAFWRQRGYK